MYLFLLKHNSVAGGELMHYAPALSNTLHSDKPSYHALVQIQIYSVS